LFFKKYGFKGNMKISSVYFLKVIWKLIEYNWKQIADTIFVRHPVYFYIYIHNGITEEYIIYDKIYAYICSVNGGVEKSTYLVEIRYYFFKSAAV